MKAHRPIKMDKTTGSLVIRAFCIVLAAWLILTAGKVYSTGTQQMDPGVRARTIAEIEAKNRMLRAKFDLWNYGTTAAMKTGSDGAYIGTGAPIAAEARVK